MNEFQIRTEVGTPLQSPVGPPDRPKISTAHSPDLGSMARNWLKELSLPTRFAMLAGLLVLGAMVVLGAWISQRIQDGVVGHAAQQTAYDMESLLEPFSADFAHSGELTVRGHAAIARMLESGPPGAGILAVRLWRPDGTLIHDSTLATAHAPRAKMDSPPELDRALRGAIVHSYNVEADGHVAAVSAMFGVPLIEIFAPLRTDGIPRIIAVAEYYQSAEALEAEIASSRRQTWTLMLLTGLITVTALYLLIRKGHEIIEEQRGELEEKIDQQRLLTLESEDLRQRLERAGQLGVELNERFLRRVGSDLHDGPAQHLALALLKMDEVARFIASGQRTDKPGAIEALGLVRHAASEAMKEIRNISAGLAVPELQKLSPAEVLATAARQHERATGTPVDLDLAPLPPRLPLPITISLYRFAQEGLNNAFRHAGGKGQRLSARSDGRSVEVEIADSGPGFTLKDVAAKQERLGLSGLRQRIEALGGSFEIVSLPGEGTRLRATFNRPALRGSRD